MTGAPGSFIHRFVPGPGDAAATTLLLLHGTGGTETDLLGLGASLLPGAALLSPRGRVLENGMPRFFRRLAEGVFDLDDLRTRTHELADFVRDACDAYGLDPNRVVAVGYSNGANIAASTLLLRPGTLAAAALFRPMVPLVPQTPPDLSGKAVLVAGGQHDPIVPIRESRRLVELLAAAGASVETHWHPGGHELGGDDLDAARQWLRALPVARA
jgi:phospholipase/carboxylesterase/glyoxalase family protein